MAGILYKTPDPNVSAYVNMILITDYTTAEAKTGPEKCRNHEPAVCPFCGHPLKYRDKRTRIYKIYSGKKCKIVIRRLICSRRNGGCGRLHNELPDFLVPYKHYTSEIIENVIEGISTPYDKTSEDYPCEKTMHRWIAWFFYNYVLFEIIARYLRSLAAGSPALSVKGVLSQISCMRKKGAGWLSVLIRYIYNCGGKTNAWKW